MYPHERFVKDRTKRDREAMLEVQRSQLRKGLSIINAMRHEGRLFPEQHIRRMARIVRIGRMWGITEEELKT